MGETLVQIATALRRWESEQAKSLGSEISSVQLAPATPALALGLVAATSALQVEVSARLGPEFIELPCGDPSLKIGIQI